MICRIEFEYDEKLARAVAYHYGDDRPATHEEMRRHFQANGESVDDDLMYEYETDSHNTNSAMRRGGND